MARLHVLAVPRGSREEALPANPIPARELALALVLSSSLVGLLLALSDLKTTDTAAFRDPGWDRHFYVEMARHNPLDFHIAPFCWRVLVPSLVKLSPLGMQTSFLLLAATAAVATGTIFYATLRRLGFEPALAVVGMMSWFAIGWSTRFQMVDFWIPDSVAFMFVALCFWFAVSRQPVAFAVVLMLGAMAKESVLLAAPLYYTLSTPRLLDLRLLATTVIAVAPAVAAVALLRLTIDAQNTDAAYVQSLPEHISRFPEILPEYDYRTLFRDIAIDQRLEQRDLDTWLSYTTKPFTPALFLLALGGVIANPIVALRLAPFLALVYSQLFFATDTQRLLALGGFAVVWLALEALRSIATRFSLAPAGLFLLPAVLLGWLLLDGDRYEAPFWVAAVALVAAASASLAPPAFRRRAFERDG